ncbi:MAG: AraC family transcriptional regulator [Lewinellaceae bacterium]|nr:AraC family transcriptional regulator [Lewinellaceae bacterium]
MILIHTPFLSTPFPGYRHFSPGAARKNGNTADRAICTLTWILVADVCYQTGFKTPKYFSKCFREFFGILPSEYGRRKK